MFPVRYGLNLYLLYNRTSGFGAGNKQKSHKIMKMQTFVMLNKANPDTGSIRGLNLAAVKHKTVQVTRLPL
jgi:hypothetical protein